MKIQLNKFNDNLIIPTRGHYDDAGMDCYALESFTIPSALNNNKENNSNTNVTVVGLGFGLEVPNGYMAVIKPRSSMNIKGIITQIGTIDSGYRGEIKAAFINLSNEDYFVEKGSRICQIVIEPVVIANLSTNLSLKEARGEGGFGSTGV